MTSWETYKATMVEAVTLATAARCNDVAEIVRLLVDGADIDARDHRGFSALMLAAYGGHAEAFALLLARGANPDSRDAAGNTVLMGAAFKGHLQMVRALVAAGADTTARNHAGLDARGFAQMFGRTDAVALLDEIATDQARKTALP